ncbi:MAG: response regulator [Chloroflexi bacterium]|nr:response regulator [Chloroflexota bacterium]
MSGNSLQPSDLSRIHIEHISRAMMEALFVVDARGVILNVNNAACKILGYGEKELVGQSLAIVMLEAASFLQNSVKDAGRDDMFANVEAAFTAKNGRAIDATLSGSIIRDGDNAAREFVLAMQDVTVRKRIIDALRESEERLRSTLSSISDLIFVLNKNLVFVDYYLAESGEAFLPVEMVIGKTVADVFPSPTAQRLENAIQQVAATKSALRFDYPLVIDDKELWFNARVTIRNGETGEFVGVTVVVRDITARKRTAEALHQAKEVAEAATQAKSEFLANMSHEIRTPLNGIIGMTSLLFDTALDGEQRDFVRSLRNSGDALHTIVNDILDFSKIESGQLELEEESFDLHRCVEEALDLLAPKATAKGLQLAYSVQGDIPATILGDVTRLRQVLLNLLGNAVKFTEKGEVVVILQCKTLVENEHELHFTVKDTGIGIPKDRMHRLFKSFSQVDSSTTRRFGGTGLGLAISKRLIAMMGGEIWVESELGQGSTFHFTIRAQASSIQTQHYLYKPQPELEGKRLLIVDNGGINRWLLIQLAKSWGMEPTAVLPFEALTWMQKGPNIDIAIVDAQLSGANTGELAAQIRQHRGAEKLPIILVTSLGQAKNRDDLFMASLSNPVKPSQLFNLFADTFGIEKQDEQPSLEKLPFDPQMGRQKPLSILLTEDNLINQKVALRILERLGYHADVANNGLEAVAALERQSYDVILMDIQMPEMNGLEATQHIRKTWLDAEQPYIVAMTANALTGDKERFLTGGIDDYVSKPIYIEELVQSLERAYVMRLASEAANDA